MSKVLAVTNLTKHYQDGALRREVLTDCSFVVYAGEVHCFLGPSGSGKTTLLNCISGLDDFNSGEIKLLGTNVNTLTNTEFDALRAADIGFVYQSHHLLLDLSVIDNIAMPAVLAGVKIKTAKQLAYELLCDFDLIAVKDSVTHFLSGGERQRVAVARALINKPKLLIADEPTGNLDYANAQLVIEKLYNYVKNNQGALVMATHDLELLKTGCIRHDYISNKFVALKVK